MLFNQYFIKTKEDLENVTNMMQNAFDKKLSVSAIIQLTKEEEEKHIIDKLSNILTGMEEYHSKKCSEFEKKHIINYVNKINGSRVKSEHMKMLFKKFNLNY